MFFELMDEFNPILCKNVSFFDFWLIKYSIKKKLLSGSVDIIVSSVLLDTVSIQSSS